MDKSQDQSMLNTGTTLGALYIGEGYNDNMFPDVDFTQVKYVFRRECCRWFNYLRRL